MYAKKYNATSQTWQPTGKIWTTKSSDLILPATIYCDGSNITTYTIKGNTVQYGTPTPDNPIMPQGCGDLETVGAKAGQYKTPISSASTITPIYLGEVQTTRRIKKLVLTGEEEFNKNAASSSNYLYYKPRNALLPNSIEKTLLICNELPVTNEPPVSQIGISGNNNFNVIYVNFGADIMNAQPSGNTAKGLKEYLAAQYAAGTPVTIWYVLAEPTTGIVNEPLQKIGDYADSITSSQAGVSIPTVAGDNTISVDTTVQPSEFTATWTGWHELVGKVFDGTDWI